MNLTDTTAIGESVSLRLMPLHVQVSDSTGMLDAATMPWEGAMIVQLGFQLAPYDIQPTI